jgi:glucosamine--fructose-6-phosphate aminotransferase (isomerizing)
MVDRGFPVFVIAPDGAMVPEIEALVRRVKEGGAEVLMIGNHPDLMRMADHTLALPTQIPEWLSPIPAIIPAQMFSMYLAQTRGIDVDNPRGLKKVTETW